MGLNNGKLLLVAALIGSAMGAVLAFIPTADGPTRVFSFLLILVSSAILIELIFFAPIRRARTVLQRVAQGDFTPRATPMLGGGELLVKEINEAAESVQTHIKRIEQQNWENATLYKALSSLLISQDMAEVAQQMAASLVAHFDYVDCGVMVLDAENGEITRLGRVGEFGVAPQARLTLKGKGLVPECMRTGQTIYVPDVRYDPRYLSSHVRTRSELVVPLIADGQVFGVLDLQSPNLDGFSARDRRIVGEFAAHAAFMLDNARLYQLLRRYNSELEDRVMTRTSELSLALDREKQLNELKGRFTSMVSHEFRSPLAVIKASNELLLRYSDKLSPEKKDHHHRIIDGQINQLVQLLDDVLFIHRTDAIGLEYEPQKVKLVSLVNEIAAEQVLAIEGSHILNYTYTGSQAPVSLDGKLIRLMLNNLLSNAVKYSPKGSSIEFTVNQSTDHVMFMIKDHGIGIPEVDFPKLFEAYHRASNATKFKGTGIGLAVVKRVVDSHNGTIQVESVVEQGTTFTITLPL